MPHQLAYKRLSRTDGHRKALLRNLATSFFKYEKIRMPGFGEPGFNSLLAAEIKSDLKFYDEPSHRAGVDGDVEQAVPGDVQRQDLAGGQHHRPESG